MPGGREEEVANDPSISDAMRVEIAHSAGMNVKDQGHSQRHKFTVSNTEVSGTVHLTAQGDAKANEWQLTADVINFTGRVAVPTTTAANTDIPNLEKGKEYAFFHKAIFPGHNNVWEGPILWMVV